MATRLEFVKSHYLSNNHYDLTMDLCCDKLTNDVFELISIVNGFFGNNNDKEVKQAIEDYKLIFN